MKWRQVFFAAVGGKAVESRADELHQRGFASLVGAVKQRHAGRKGIDRQAGPNSKAVDLYVANLHADVILTGGKLFEGSASDRQNV